MEEMKNVKSDGSLGNETEKEVVFIDLFLMITMPLKVRSAYLRTIVQRETKFFAPQTVEDIMSRSSMKAAIGGNEIIFI